MEAVLSSSKEVFMGSQNIPDDILGDVRHVYSDTVIDHAMNPRNVGEMDNADGSASMTGPCGDVMEMWIRVCSGQVTEARFWTSGCATTIAAGSVTAEMSTGMTLAEIQRINPGKILDTLGGLPEESQECAVMAASTIKSAVMNYLDLQREPWKKAFRKR